MATAPLNIDTKRLPPTPQWSPILSHSRSPSLSSPRSSEDLSSRCRKLARSFGESALVDDFDQPCTSPARSRENSESFSSPSSFESPPLSAHRHHVFPLSPPTPEGAHVLNEILEEESEPQLEEDEREQQQKGLGFTDSTENEEPIQFKLSPMIGNQLSLHGASLAMEGLTRDEAGGGGGLGLSLHDRMKIDTFEQEPQVDDETELEQEIKRANNWIELELELVDGDLLARPADRTDAAFKSFSLCYADPLLNICKKMCRSSPVPAFSPHHRHFSSSSSPPSSPQKPSHSLLPSTGPTVSDPLYLYLRITSEDSSLLTLQYLECSLQPLHDNHFLTSYCPNSRLLSRAPIIVLFSGTTNSSEGGGGGGRRKDSEMEKILDTPRIIFRPVEVEELETSTSSSSSFSYINPQSHPVVIVKVNKGQGGSSKEVDDERLRKARDQGFIVKARSDRTIS